MILYVWKYAPDSESGRNFQKTAVIDYAISVIWVQRFQDTGEFELYLPATKELFLLFTDGMLFITRENDEQHAMKIESVQLTTDEEAGDHLIISGRSVECILEQRIILKQTTLAGQADEIIYDLIRINAIEPEGVGNTLKEMRKISELSVDTRKISDSQIQIQLDGESLLETIRNICISTDMGFRLIFTGSGFLFQLYHGLDRTLYQTENSPVIFSSEFENLGNTEYSYDMTTYYNLIHEGGEGEGSDRMHATVIESDQIKGLYLREKYVQAETISSTTEDGQMNSSEYLQILKQRAEANLRQSKVTRKFSGEILDTGMYEFGKDYGLGDTVSIVNQYGISGTAIVTEITEVEDETGYTLTPTFSDWRLD